MAKLHLNTKLMQEMAKPNLPCSPITPWTVGKDGEDQIFMGNAPLDTRAGLLLAAAREGEMGALACCKRREPAPR